MTNNDILRRVRYLFKYNDQKMIAIFKHAEHNVEPADVSAWLKKEDEDLYKEITDKELATFLNGLIIEKRGKREGPLPEPEDPLNNNMILKKLKTALDLKTDDILNLLSSIDKKIGKHELSAFFRSPENSSYRPCLDQYLRNFLNALQTKFSNDQNKEN
ncbi:MAG TPA: DUF1456 family protein [Edaphocola sp.]|nr:DUF1456 family protein [Edaphocola sp.]